MKQNWEIKKLGDVCEKKQNIKWKDESNESYYSYIDLSSVNRDTNQIDETQKINAFNAPSRAQQIVKEGDVIFGTTRPTLKRVCIIPSQYDNQICSTGFCVLRANKKLVYPTWIYHFLLSEDFYKYIEPLQRGANYPAVTDSDVMNFSISLPPLAEQERIVKELDALSAKINTLKANYRRQIECCDELRQSLLKKAFEGEL